MVSGFSLELTAFLSAFAAHAFRKTFDYGIFQIIHIVIECDFIQF